MRPKSVYFKISYKQFTYFFPDMTLQSFPIKIWRGEQMEVFGLVLITADSVVDTALVVTSLHTLLNEENRVRC